MEINVMRRTVLRGDAVFLTLAGLFGLTADLLSYVAGTGPFGRTFYQDPTVIGVVEAHALAIVIAATLWHHARTGASHHGQWAGIAAHAVMGVSNIVWFDVFSRVQAETQGVAVTVVHFVFIAGHAALMAARRDSGLHLWQTLPVTEVPHTPDDRS